MAKRFQLDGVHEDSTQIDQSSNYPDKEITSINYEFMKEEEPLSQEVVKEEADKETYLSTYSTVGTIKLSSQNIQARKVTSNIAQSLGEIEDVKMKIKDMDLANTRIRICTSNVHLDLNARSAVKSPQNCQILRSTLRFILKD